jgi:hypothetical protein
MGRSSESPNFHTLDSRTKFASQNRPIFVFVPHFLGLLGNPHLSFFHILGPSAPTDDIAPMLTKPARIRQPIKPLRAPVSACTLRPLSIRDRAVLNFDGLEFAASLPDQTELLGILCPVRAYTRAAADSMTSVRDGFSDSLTVYHRIVQ